MPICVTLVVPCPRISLPCLDVGMLFVMSGDFSGEVIFPQCSADMGRGQGGLNTSPPEQSPQLPTEHQTLNHILAIISFQNTLLVFISCFIVREHRVNL